MLITQRVINFILHILKNAPTIRAMSDDQRVHEIVSSVKDLAIKLGHTPSRMEILDSGIVRSTHEVQKYFGGFSQLIQAAGLDPAKKKRSLKDVFVTDIDRHLERYTPRKVNVAPPKYAKIASISDIHWPFHNQKVITAFLNFIKEHQPEYVIINGDAWDMYSHAKFPRSHNQFTPRDEMRMARESNVAFWKEVKQHCPKAKCVQMMGNHDVRPMKRVMEAYPEAEDWIKKALEENFTFDGVRTIFDPREELMIGDIAIFHGYRSKLGEHRDYTLYNCINGHTHRGGTVFRKIRGSVIWELNSGFAGDPEAKGLTYTPQRINEWTPGFGFIWPWGPQFIIVV